MYQLGENLPNLVTLPASKKMAGKVSGQRQPKPQMHSKSCFVTAPLLDLTFSSRGTTVSRGQFFLIGFSNLRGKFMPS
jgi:hypothetical protein